MSTRYVVALAVTVVAILTARFLVTALPLRRVAVRLTVTDTVLAALGVAGLVFHCGAMFFRSAAEALPGADALVREIDALGTVSVVLYVVPAALVVLGLRRQTPVAVAAVVLALTAVGVTMYNGGPLDTHLTAIFVSIVTLAVIASALVLPPWRVPSDARG